MMFVVTPNATWWSASRIRRWRRGGRVYSVADWEREKSGRYQVTIPREVVSPRVCMCSGARSHIYRYRKYVLDEGCLVDILERALI